MKTRHRTFTGANRENGERNLCSLRSLMLNSGRGVVEIDFDLANPARRDVNMNPESFRGYSRRDGDADFKFLARDPSPTYVDNRPLLVADKPESHPGSPSGYNPAIPRVERLLANSLSLPP